MRHPAIYHERDDVSGVSRSVWGQEAETRQEGDAGICRSKAPESKSAHGAHGREVKPVGRRQPSAQVDWTEWQLNPRMFQVLAQEWGPFGLDAFAAEWNNQLPRYYSKHFHDVSALGRDAMVQQLSQEQAVIYAFPPPIRRLVERFIQLVDTGSLEVVLVMPLERSAIVAQALQRSASTPFIFQRSEALLLPPTAYGRHKESSYPLSKLVSWKALIGIRLSGQTSSCEGFLRSWQQQCHSSTSSRTPV